MERPAPIHMPANHSALSFVILIAGLGGAALMGGCHSTASGTTSEQLGDGAARGAAPASASGRFDRLERLAFNRRAVELDQPLFWRSDANGNHVLEPNELVVTWSYAPVARTEFVDRKNDFTPKFRALYERMLRTDDANQLGSAEKNRRQAVQRELSQGRPTLLESDFSSADAGEKALVAHLLRVATQIEHLYARQKGTGGLESRIPADDTASAAMFFRNQGPFCEAPKTEKDPACLALPDPIKPIFGLYPPEIQQDKSFCELLQKQPNAGQLSDHFSIVARGDAPNTFRPVKYSEAYKDDMEAVAKELEAASSQLGDDEAALKKYLNAAAKAFRDDDWEPANEAWVGTGEGHSKYYLRVGPDEVYFEPCAWKAAFAFAFARINKESVEWRDRLEPIKQQLEDEFAGLAGKPYRARPVHFKLPDFIDIVLNAGDNRRPRGANAGQSLPNWGRVAEKGGRTMTMTNLDNDADGRKAFMDRMASLCCHATMGSVSADPKLDLMGTVLHEAAHNLGPSYEYRVRGKVDHAVFGGPLASMLEELKAETAAMYFPAELVRRKLVTQRDVDLAKMGAVAWAFGSVAQGLYDSEGRPRPYGQLASIQLGVLQRAGALEWRAGETAGNASDRGCFELHRDKWQAAVAALFKQVLQIKSRGDRRGAEDLKKAWVDDDNDWKKVRDVVTERWLRAPRASYAYSVSGL
jgi:hypothetical protein